MPRSQEEHYNYTLNEWTKSPFTNMLEIIFNDTSVKSFIDIGANVGGVTSALVKLNYIQKLNNIICFEPDSENFNYLINVCEKICIDYPNINIVCHNIGIYYGKTESQVCAGGNDNVGGYFVKDDTISRSFNNYTYEDKIFKLDEIEKYVDCIDFAKMDIEGGEVNLLKYSSILKNCKYLLLEWHYSNDEFIKFFEENLSTNYIILLNYSQHSQYLLKNKNNDL